MSSYLTIEMSYDLKYVLPLKEGLEFLKLLSSAELLTERYNEESRITGLKTYSPTIKIMDEARYKEIKTQTLLFEKDNG
jgi:hypothetical protein